MDLSSDKTAFTLRPGDTQGILRWREEMERAFPPLHIIPADATTFTASYAGAGAADLQVSDIRASAHTAERRPGRITEHNIGYYKISYQVAGTGVMSQGNRELLLTPGTIALYDTALPYDLHFDNDYRFIVAMFPKVALDLPEGLATELTAYPVDGESGPASMAAQFLLSLADNLDILPGPSGNRIARTGLDLLASLVGSEVDSSLISDRRDRKTFLVGLCHYINQHLQDPTLSAESIAAAHFISTRHLHNIFQVGGVTLAQWIKQRRLQECRGDLSDPLNATRSVAEIASHWTFVDPGYFSRIFKQSFGSSPSEWRRSVLMVAA